AVGATAAHDIPNPDPGSGCGWLQATAVRQAAATTSAARDTGAPPQNRSATLVRRAQPSGGSRADAPKRTRGRARTDQFHRRALTGGAGGAPHPAGGRPPPPGKATPHPLRRPPHPPPHPPHPPPPPP